MKKKTIFGIVMMGIGAAAGAYCAKKYYDKRKVRVAQYNTEVDRLQKEVDFEYTEDFLKELKKETMSGNKQTISKEDVLKALNDAKENVKNKGEEIEKVIKMYMKKYGYAEDSDFEQLDFLDVENEKSDGANTEQPKEVNTITIEITAEDSNEVDSGEETEEKPEEC